MQVSVFEIVQNAKDQLEQLGLEAPESCKAMFEKAAHKVMDNILDTPIEKAERLCTR